MTYDTNFGVLVAYADDILRALMVTLGISTAALLISLPLGLGGALLRTSKRRSVRLAAATYVEVLRNVPLLVVVYLVYYELPALGIRLDAIWAGIAALTVNSTAYLIEIFRGAFEAIPRGQYEASASLGLRPAGAFRHVILPQLLRVAFPALGNQVVGLILGSSLVSVVGAAELTNTAYAIGSRTFRFFEVFVVAAICYFLAVQLVNWIWNAAGHRWITGHAQAVTRYG